MSLKNSNDTIGNRTSGLPVCVASRLNHYATARPTFVTNKLSKGVPRHAEVAQGVPGSLRPRIVLTFRHYKGGRSSAIRTGRLYPRRNPWYSFSGTQSTPGHKVLSEGTTEKIPSDTTGNRSRDRPTSSITLTTTPPQATTFVTNTSRYPIQL